MDPTVTGTDKRGQVFHIRRFEANDRPALDAMYRSFEPKRAAQGLPPADPELIDRWLNGLLPQGLHVVVIVDREVVGHGMLLPFDPGAAELANFLHQALRDRGIGTVLNQALVDLARAEGFQRIWLSVQPSNRRAIRSYEKVGFRRLQATTWTPEIEMEMTMAGPGAVTPFL